jgi:4'-phosphopantetheinyl transferase
VAWSVAQFIAGNGPDKTRTAGSRREADRETRRRSACALIGRLADVPADRVRLARSKAGAPIVVMPAGWHLGLSSRGSHALIGVATEPIAVDRELFDRAPPLWDMLTDAEANAVRRVAMAAQPGEWLRRWTIKEAHAKLIGEPRRIAPDSIDTTVIDPHRATARFEGVSQCWTRIVGGAIETVAQWSGASLTPAR